MLFREHRGGYEESMATVVEVKSMDELVDHLGFPHEIKFEQYGFDERNGWDAYLVLVDGRPIGMSNGNTFEIK